jgi:hypothetical protein
MQAGLPPWQNSVLSLHLKSVGQILSIHVEEFSSIICLEEKGDFFLEEKGPAWTGWSKALTNTC